MYLQLHQLSVRYPGLAHSAVSDVSFGLQAGEIGVLIGPSGCGKTTLLRAVAGLESVSSGSVQLAGIEVSRAGYSKAPEQRRIGMVFQDYALFPHMDIGRNVAFGIMHLKDAERRERVREVLALVGLEGERRRMPHELSGGQQQRVALARALVRIQDSDGSHDASARGVLLLDEPFSAVDAPMRQVLYRELAQLRQSLNVPIVLVTHDLHEARRLADRIVIIDAGHTLQSGPPAQVMRSPRNARVAQLVGIHNHFHGQFNSTGDGRAVLHWGDLRLKVRDKGKIDSGTKVTWVLAGEAVQIIAAGQAISPQDNLLACTITEMLPLGEISLCRLAVNSTPDTIQLNLPTAQLSALSLIIGGSITLNIPIDAAHIMPVRA